MKSCVLVGIAGPSGSGKSTLAQNLAQHIAGARILHADTYYRPEAALPKLVSPLTGETLPDWNTPGALRQEALAAAIDTAEAEGGVVLVEGAFLFCFSALLGRFDLRVYTEAPIETRIYRRIRRNMAQRGLPMEEIADYYLAAARYSERQNTLNTAHLADFIIHTEGDAERQSTQLVRLIRAIEKEKIHEN